MAELKILTMPKLGESVTEGTVVRWLVKPGDTVHAYDPICEVETDKVTAEVPAPEAGRVVERLVAEGETVQVGTPIMRFEVEHTASAEDDTLLHEQSSKEQKPPAISTSASSEPQHSNPASVTKDTVGRRRYSPAVLRLAGEYGIDLNQVTGTGEHGRVTRKDVLNFIATGQTATASSTAQAIPASFDNTARSKEQHAKEASVSDESLPNAMRPSHLQEDKALQIEGADRLVPLSTVRRTIARRMVESKQTAPHAWMMVEVDVTKLVQHREQIKEQFYKQEGIRLTYLPFFILSVVRALKQYPVLNASWTEEGILYKKDIHISIAVAHNDLLYVPVIHHADEKSLIGLARAIDDLVSRTRQGKLKIEDTEGGTFTVNNTGAFGSILSMPIINQPQAAILSIEAIVKRPVVIDGMIAIRDMVNLTLSLDHRVLDGAVAGRFLQKIKHDLENFEPHSYHN